MRTILVLTALLGLGACHTWDGAADDLAAAGHGVKKSVSGRDRGEQPSDYWDHSENRANRYQSHSVE